MTIEDSETPTSASDTAINTVRELHDLASARVGARVVVVSDAALGAADRLLDPDPPAASSREGSDGVSVDGWITGRRRGEGHEWCIVRLGQPALVHAVAVDTRGFAESAPPRCSIDAANLAGGTSAAEVETADFDELVRPSTLIKGGETLLLVERASRVTHVRLNLIPDGGVARLRVYGVAMPNWPRLLSERRILDLAALEHGGQVISASDELVGDRRNLILPGISHGPHDGWKSRRRRGPGHDWVIFELGRAGRLTRAEIDTAYFRGDQPEAVSLEGCFAPQAGRRVDRLRAFRELMPRRRLSAHDCQELELIASEQVTHVRMNVYPDGGIARVRLFGEPT